jgi:hypothetical protein
VYDSVDMLVPGSPSLILSDFSHFVTLPFVAAYDLNQIPTPSQVDGKPMLKKVTYIAICKRVMPVLAHLYNRFKASADIYADGTVDAILAVSPSSVFLVISSVLITTLGIRNPNQTEIRLSGSFKIRFRSTLVENGDDKLLVGGTGMCSARRRVYWYAYPHSAASKLTNPQNALIRQSPILGGNC